METCVGGWVQKLYRLEVQEGEMAEHRIKGILLQRWWEILCVISLSRIISLKIQDALTDPAGGWRPVLTNPGLDSHFFFYQLAFAVHLYELEGGQNLFGKMCVCFFPQSE